MALPWDPYPQSLVASGSVALAAVYGHDGNVWGRYPQDLGITPTEVQTLSGQMSSGRADSISLGGIKYMVGLIDTNTFYGVKGDNNICVCKTNKTFVVGISKKPMAPGNLNKTVEKLADQLKESGW